MTITDIRPTLRFLREAYGEHSEGFLSVFVGDDQNITHWFQADDLEAAAGRSVALAKNNNVYFGVGLQEKKPEKGRGKAGTVCSIPGVWADIDVAGPAHKSQNLPPSLGDAREWAHRFPLKPTLIVDSGNGIYVWLLFKEPLTIESDEERQYAHGLVKRFQDVMRQYGNGWDLDPTADLARLLRLPGTINHKQEPKTVTVIEHDLDSRYDPGEIERYLPTEAPRPLRATNTPADDADFTPADLDKIATECAWMRHCHDNAATLNEPHWYAALSIIGRCVEGEQLAHDWSEPHPGYSEDETSEKLGQALERSGPRTCKYVRDDLAGAKFCDGCKHWGKITTPLQLGRQATVFTQSTELDGTPESEEGVALNDFYAHMPSHAYIFRANGETWPASSVNSRLPRVPTGESDQKGRPKTVAPAVWLDRNRAVEQLTWAPGEPELICDRLISHGGWIHRPGVSIYNLYRPPTVQLGDPRKALHFIELVNKVYPEHADHIFDWFAHRVQRPGEKINHALLLGGEPGIGKDTILEGLKHAVGPWNFAEAAPSHIMGRFNGYVKSVVLRISEARDLGESDRNSFYEHMKTLTAAPPDVLRVDEKNRQEYAVFNVTGVVITTNHKTGGIFLPPNDRRHYVAWSDCTSADFAPLQWDFIYRWFAQGGYGHIAAWLAEYDLAHFNPKAPPLKTAAFWDIVDASQAPEDAELADIIEALYDPDAVALSQIISKADPDFREWLKDRRNSRKIPHRLEAVGYVRVRNDDAKDGQWRVYGKRQAVYAKKDLDVRSRIAAAHGLADSGYLREVA